MVKFIFFIVLLIPIYSSAQVKDSLLEEGVSKRIKPPKLEPKVKYKSTVVSMPYRVFRDEGHSPLIHSGATFQIAKYNERWRKKTMTKYEMVLGIGLIHSNKKELSVYTRASTLNMEINYHYLFPIRKIFKEKGDWYVGVILTNTFDGRLYSFLPNNSFGYEFSNVINPATHITYNFKIGSVRKYQAGFKLNFALLAHVVRPNYIGMEPQSTYMGEKINAFTIFTHGNKIALPNHFFRINTEIYFDRFNIFNNDKFRLFYGWGVHVTKLSNSNPLYSAYHSLGFVSMLYSQKSKRNKGLKKVDYL